MKILAMLFIVFMGLFMGKTEISPGVFTIKHPILAIAFIIVGMMIIFGNSHK
jgi:hypothetical protein